MDVMVERCCGLDVHRAKVVACLLVGAPGQRPKKEIRTFATHRAALRELRDWLVATGCTHVAMASTGVYWVPVYAVLEGSVELVVGNAQHIKNVPGRKADVKDCAWIATLQRHGLIRRSLVPPKPQRELRDQLRYRRKLAEAGGAPYSGRTNVAERAGVRSMAHHRRQHDAIQGVCDRRSPLAPAAGAGLSQVRP